MAKGIYERQEKNGDAVYRLRYQVDGKDFKERAERKPRSLSREPRKQTGGKSPSLMCFSIVFSVATFIGVVFAQQEPLTIDVVNATLNSKVIFNMVVDDVTSALGRPSAVDDNRLLAGTIGPQVDYHPLGLSFRFDGKKIESDQKLFMMTIYLSRAWNAKARKFFETFRGRITKNLSGNWKLDRTTDEFKEFTQKVRTPEELERQLKDLRVYRPGSTLNYMVSVTLPTHTINFSHESVTHFLESLSVIRKGQ